MDERLLPLERALRHHLAWAQFRAGRANEARQTLEELPTTAEVVEHRLRLYLIEGDCWSARRLVSQNRTTLDPEAQRACRWLLGALEEGRPLDSVGSRFPWCSYYQAHLQLAAGQRQLALASLASYFRQLSAPYPEASWVALEAMYGAWEAREADRLLRQVADLGEADRCPRCFLAPAREDASYCARCFEEAREAGDRNAVTVGKLGQSLEFTLALGGPTQVPDFRLADPARFYHELRPESATWLAQAHQLAAQQRRERTTAGDLTLAMLDAGCFQKKDAAALREGALLASSREAASELSSSLSEPLVWALNIARWEALSGILGASPIDALELRWGLALANGGVDQLFRATEKALVWGIASLNPQQVAAALEELAAAHPQQLYPRLRLIQTYLRSPDPLQQQRHQRLVLQLLRDHPDLYLMGGCIRTLTPAAYLEALGIWLSHLPTLLRQPDCLEALYHTVWADQVQSTMKGHGTSVVR